MTEAYNFDDAFYDNVENLLQYCAEGNIDGVQSIFAAYPDHHAILLKIYVTDGV